MKVDKNELKNLGSGLYLDENTGINYVFLEGRENLEDPKFNENLEKIYKEHKGNDIQIVVDGQILRERDSRSSNYNGR